MNSLTKIMVTICNTFRSDREQKITEYLSNASKCVHMRGARGGHATNHAFIKSIGEPTSNEIERIRRTLSSAYSSSSGKWSEYGASEMCEHLIYVIDRNKLSHSLNA